MITRRTLLKTSPSLLVPAAAKADKLGDYPNRPVTLIVPLAAGSASDGQARIVAKVLSERIGQSVVVLNKAGANGLIAMEYLFNQKPDGYTITVLTNGIFGAVATANRALSFDLRTVTPISGLARNTQLLVVHPSMPIRTVDELIDYLKARPGEVNVGTGNMSGKISFELFKDIAGVDVVEVPFNGDPPLMTAVLGEHVKVGFMLTGACLGNVLEGKFRALAIMDDVRFAALPDVPAIVEKRPAFEELAAVGPRGSIAGPPGIPDDIAKFISDNVRIVLTESSVVESLEKTGSIPNPSSREDHRAWVLDQIDRFDAIVKKYKIKV